jgi:hypothetical protein
MAYICLVNNLHYTNMSKLHKLPVKPYVFRFIEPQLENGVYKINRRVVRTIKNNVRVNEYFEKNKDSQYYILVELRSSSLYTLHGLQMDLSREFRDKLYTHIAISVKGGGTAMSAIRSFFEFYNITEDDYDIGSAYRTWLREREKYLNAKEYMEKKISLKTEKLERKKSPGIQMNLF